MAYRDTLPQGVWVGGSTGTVPVRPKLLWRIGILCHRGMGVLGGW